MSPGCDESCCYWVDVGIPVNIENDLSKGVLVGIGIKVIGKIRRIEGSTLETAVGSDEGTTDGSRKGISDRFNAGCDKG